MQELRGRENVRDKDTVETVEEHEHMWAVREDSTIRYCFHCNRLEIWVESKGTWKEITVHDA